MAKPKLKVKQNSAAGSAGVKIEAKNKWQRRDSNPRPKAYESSALPLSYAANSRKIYHH